MYIQRFSECQEQCCKQQYVHLPDNALASKEYCGRETTTSSRVISSSSRDDDLGANEPHIVATEKKNGKLIKELLVSTLLDCVGLIR